MSTPALENLNVVGLDPMPTPAAVHEAVPLSERAAATVAAAAARCRQSWSDAIRGRSWWSVPARSTIRPRHSTTRSA